MYLMNIVHKTPKPQTSSEFETPSLAAHRKTGQGLSKPLYASHNLSRDLAQMAPQSLFQPARSYESISYKLQGKEHRELKIKK